MTLVRYMAILEMQNVTELRLAFGKLLRSVVDERAKEPPLVRKKKKKLILAILYYITILLEWFLRSETTKLSPQGKVYIRKSKC